MPAKRQRRVPAAIPAAAATPAAPPPVPWDGPETLAWRFNPWRHNWRRPALALAIILGVAALAGISFSWPQWWPAMLAWGGVSLLLLLGMTATLYLPVSYQLDRNGVTVRFLGAPSFRRWAHYRNAYFHRNGVHLTTLPSPSALDPFRGHLLQFTPGDAQGDRAQVQPFIEACLAPYRGLPEGPA